MTDNEIVAEIQPPLRRPASREERIAQIQVQQAAGLNQALIAVQVDLEIANERIRELEEQVRNLEATLAPFLSAEPPAEEVSPETSPATAALEEPKNEVAL